MSVLSHLVLSELPPGSELRYDHLRDKCFYKTPQGDSGEVVFSRTHPSRFVLMSFDKVKPDDEEDCVVFSTDIPTIECKYDRTTV